MEPSSASTEASVASEPAELASAKSDETETVASIEPSGPADSVVPDEPIPLGDEVMGHVGLPCGTPSACPQRVRLAETVSLYAKAKGGTRLVTNAKPDSVPAIEAVEVADEGGQGDRVHLICKAADYSAQVFIRHSDVLPVVTQFVVATPSRTPKAATDEPQVGIWFVPGAVVKTRRTKGDAVQVAFNYYGLVGSGWIPKAAVNRLYEPATSDPRERGPGGHDFMSLSEPIDIFAKPGGSRFATIDTFAGVQRLGVTRDGHELVAAGHNLDDEVYFVGWVRQSDLESRGGILGGIVGRGPASAPREGHVRVAGGTHLVDPSGNQVGLVRQDTSLKCLAHCDSATPTVELRCVTNFAARVATPAPVGAETGT